MAGPRAERINRMIDILSDADGWVTASSLARMLGTSERSVRTYVSQVNANGGYRGRTIESGKGGYRLAGTAANAASDADPHGDARVPAASEATGPKRLSAPERDRVDHVISRLIGTDGSASNVPGTVGVSIYDLADDLYISDSTLTGSVFPAVRKLVGQFGLRCEVHDFRACLTGREQDKRKLLGYLATHNDYGYFTSTRTLEEMFPEFDVGGIMSKLVEICQRSELFINDYALSNLLVHLLVIIVRLTSNNELGERDDGIDAMGMAAELRQHDAIMDCANRISHYFEEEFGCTIPNADFQQIVLLIMLSIERYTYEELDFEKLSDLLDAEFVSSVIQILEETGARYNIPRVIDEQMRLQLILHMYNAYQRAVYHVSYPNPLAAQIKQEYAPIYDMAVFIVHRFSQVMNVEIGENEVAFIAFHIGAYFERATAPEGSATCVVIVEAYHDFAKRLVDDLKRALDGDVNIIGVMSCDGYLANMPECDVVITTIDVPVERSKKILIGPILTKQNLRKIRDNLADLLEAKRRGAAWRFLRQTLRPELYARNIDLTRHAQSIITCTDNRAKCAAGSETPSPAHAAIEYLGSLARAAGMCDAAYIADVHLRERVSSTAFTDRLAIPHAINESPNESFIAVLHNDTAIPWGRHNVNFVLLIGISRRDMGHFRDALDIIIELFSDVNRVMRLMQTDGFDEFAGEFA